MKKHIKKMEKCTTMLGKYSTRLKTEVISHLATGGA